MLAIPRRAWSTVSTRPAITGRHTARAASLVYLLVNGLRNVFTARQERRVVRMSIGASGEG